MTTTPSPCPWCHAATGFRQLTHREVLRRPPVTIVHAAASAFTNAGRPALLAESLPSPTASLRCRGCTGLVRACPNCERPERLLNGMAVTCRDCKQVYQ